MLKVVLSITIWLGALMHLNYLAGLLPFFEPSIEWEDSMPPQNLVLNVQHQEVSTLSFHYLHRHCHPQW